MPKLLFHRANHSTLLKGFLCFCWWVFLTLVSTLLSLGNSKPGDVWLVLLHASVFWMPFGLLTAAFIPSLSTFFDESAQKGLSGEYAVWWVAAGAIFLLVGLLGAKYSFFGILDTAIFLWPMMAWAALRFRLKAVAFSTTLIPLAVSLFQLNGIGGSVMPILSLPLLPISYFSELLIIQSFALVVIRAALLKNNSVYFPRRLVLLAIACIPVLVGLLMLFTGLKTKSQTELIADRVLGETSRVFKSADYALNQALSAYQISEKCNIDLKNILKEAVDATPFVSALGIGDGSGKILCSAANGKNEFIGLAGAAEGISYDIHYAGNGSLDGLLMMLRLPGGIIGYANIDIPSLRWYFDGFFDAIPEAITVNLSGKTIFSGKVDGFEYSRATYKHQSYMPEFGVDIVVQADRRSIFRAFDLLIGFIIAASIPIFILFILIAYLKMREEEARLKAEIGAKARLEFVAMMSHEIRTPMNGMLGNLELLFSDQKMKDVLAADANLQIAAKDATISAKTIMGMVVNVLDFSKAESGEINLSEEPFSPLALANNVLRNNKVLADQKNLSLTLQTDLTEKDFLMGDSIRLTQILNNLVVNAIKFTEHGEVIIVVTEKFIDEKWASLVFEVRDTGIGLDEISVKNLFNPFFQVNHKYSSMGTGLGLSISSQLAKLMGADLQVTSELGMGSTFTLKVNLMRIAKELVQESYLYPQDHLIKKNSRIKLLIVDDHKIGLDLLRRQLNQIGIECVLADSLSAAINQLNTNGGIQGVITDLNLPDGTGFELAKHIRLHLQLDKESMPVFLCTADISWSDIDREAHKLIDGILLKPYTFDDVIRLIQSSRLKSLEVNISKESPASPSDDIKALMILETNKDLERIFRDCEKKDWAAIGKSVHRIKGAALLLGDSILVNLLIELGKAAQNKDPDQILALVHSVHDHLYGID